MRWWVHALALVYLAVVLVGLLTVDRPWWAQVVVILVLMAAAVGYASMWSWVRHEREREARRQQWLAIWSEHMRRRRPWS